VRPRACRPLSPVAPPAAARRGRAGGVAPTAASPSENVGRRGRPQAAVDTRPATPAPRSIRSLSGNKASYSLPTPRAPAAAAPPGPTRSDNPQHCRLAAGGATAKPARALGPLAVARALASAPPPARGPVPHTRAAGLPAPPASPRKRTHTLLLRALLTSPGPLLLAPSFRRPRPATCHAAALPLAMLQPHLCAGCPFPRRPACLPLAARTGASPPVHDSPHA
jgi:hypothetical protein